MTAHRPVGAARWGAPLRRRDFDRAIRRGRRLTGSRVVLYVVAADGKTRAGFTAGRRIGGAVVRNRARRLMKEAWRALAPRARGGFDVVFVATPDIRDSKMHDVMGDMARLLSSAGVIRA